MFQRVDHLIEQIDHKKQSIHFLLPEGLTIFVTIHFYPRLWFKN